MSDRYNTDANSEAQYQPGSNDQVLRNKLGITDVKEMDDVELDLLEQLYDDVLDRVSLDQMLTVGDIREWHRKWLGNVYEWAGRERSVNMGKGDFEFAVAAQLPRLLKVLDKDFLSVYTPCDQMNDE